MSEIHPEVGAGYENLEEMIREATQGSTAPVPAAESIKKDPKEAAKKDDDDDGTMKIDETQMPNTRPITLRKPKPAAVIKSKKDESPLVKESPKKPEVSKKDEALANVEVPKKETLIKKTDANDLIKAEANVNENGAAPLDDEYEEDEVQFLCWYMPVNKALFLLGFIPLLFMALPLVPTSLIAQGYLFSPHIDLTAIQIITKQSPLYSYYSYIDPTCFLTGIVYAAFFLLCGAFMRRPLVLIATLITGLSLMIFIGAIALGALILANTNNFGFTLHVVMPAITLTYASLNAIWCAYCIIMGIRTWILIREEPLPDVEANKNEVPPKPPA